MDFSQVKIWQIPDEFGIMCNVTKVVDRNGEGDVIWQLFNSEYEIIDLIGHPDFQYSSATGWGCYSSLDNKNFNLDATGTIFGLDVPLYFKLGMDDGNGNVDYAIDSKDYCKIAVLVDDVNGETQDFIDKYYTNYAASGLTGTYTVNDLIKSLHSCSSLALELTLKGGETKKINLYDYKSGINPPYGNRKVYIILYGNFSVDTSITWDLEDLAIPSSAYTQDFNIYDPTQQGWMLNSSETWLTVDEVNEHGDTIITLTCSANTSTSSRAATLELLDADGNLIESKIITQAGRSVTYSLNISPKTQEVSGNGETTTITVTSSHTVTYSTTDSWLTLKMNSAGTQLTVTADPNLTRVSRTGKINFICGDKKTTASIVQGPGSDLTVQDSVTALPGTSVNAAVIPVTSSFGWTFTANLTGAIAEKTSTGDAIQIQVTSPNTGSTRKTLGTITVTDNMVTKTVTVYQDYEKIEVLTYAHNDPDATFPVGETISTLGDITWTIAVSSNTNWTLTLSGTNWTANGWTKSGNAYKYSGKGTGTTTITSPSGDTVPTATLTITYGITNKSGGKITYTT